MSKKLLALFFALASTYSISSEISIVSKSTIGSDAVFIDTRDISKCELKTIENSKCLPISGLINEQQKISFRDFYWLLSVNNLNHTDKVILFGNKLDGMKLLAGMLYLSGHEKIYLLDLNISEIYKTFPIGKSDKRGIFRTKLYEGTFRSDLIQPVESITTHSQKNNIVRFVDSIINEHHETEVKL